MTPTNAIKFIEDNGAKLVDFRFTDFLGQWQHTTVPAHEITEDIFEDGLGFDGSSIRGWQAINNSDMIMLPDSATIKMDPYTEIPTAYMICNIFDPISKERYSKDPRNIANKAIKYLQSTGLADTAYFGPEAEFFCFDNVQYDTTKNTSYVFLDSEEGDWNTGAEGRNLGYKIRPKEGYFPVPPLDSLFNMRNEMVITMEEQGLYIENSHHEVSSGGQCEIDMRFSDMVSMCDDLQTFKYIVKNTACKYGKSATFMPKPLFNDNGSGMHVHQSLWKDGKPLFAGEEYAGLSDMALYYIGGVIKHAHTIAAFTNPTTNSYKRLVPGFEAPVSLAYSSRNRSASMRIPMYSPSPKAKRVELRFPDPMANPYLAFTVMLMAGLDGIQNKIDPGEPMDKNLYDLDPIELSSIPQMPSSLEQSINALEKNHDFLLKGDVFTEDAIASWIEWKRDEIAGLNSRPHPYEFFMYYDN